jgi:hypothetical protein
MRTIALRRSFHLHRTAVQGLRTAPAGARTSILRRIFAAIERLDHRRAEREAARFIADHGGRFTDAIERQLIEYLCGGRGFRP